MIRTFHAVGQGAFYSECFRNYNLVYDCGSYKNKSLAEDEVAKSFEETEIIDALYISHFHEDHINGLEFLLNRNQVKTIYLPFLTDEEKVSVMVDNIFSNQRSEFTEQIIANPHMLRERYDTEIVLVMPYTGEIVEEINSSNIKHTPSGTHTEHDDWLWIPFHFQQSKKTKLFQKELIKAALKINNPADLLLILEDDIKYSALETCYNNIPGSLNSNSLVLYSGPNNGEKRYWAHSPSSPFYYFHLYGHGEPAGCLYFGDYDASGSRKWSELESALDRFWENLGSIQIPHHGSSYNYNYLINHKKPVISVISCGEKNHFRHPHGSVIKQILKNHGVPIMVTETPCTRLVQKIEKI